MANNQQPPTDNQPLTASVEKFAENLILLSEAQLNIPWAWGDYDSDGVRFAFFRTQEQLRELAIQMAQMRLEIGRPPSQAQRILMQYHVAYRELHALLLGLTDEEAERLPADGEWPIRRAFAHIVDAEVTFFAIQRQALNALRNCQPVPRSLTDDIWPSVMEMEIPDFEAMLEGKLSPLVAYHRSHHEKVLSELAGISDDELAADSYFWESTPFPLRFRLARFESHGRQHAIQIEKTMPAVGLPITEARLLVRMLYLALAEAENQWIGAPDLPDPQSATLAQEIEERLSELLSLF